MKNIDQQDRFENALASLQGMKRATAPAGLLEQIQRRISQTGKQIQLIPAYKVSLVAASLVILLTMNVYLLTHNNKQEAARQDAVAHAADYYGLTDNNNWGL